MNDYITAQVQQMRVYVQAWEASCVLAAKKNDGVRDVAEAKALQRIHRAVRRFTQDLARI